VTVRLSLAVAAPQVDAAILERFLESLDDAGLGPDDEVLIAATSRPGERAHAELRVRASRVPAVHLRLHRGHHTPMQLWGLAMARACGSHVAVLDVRDPPGAGWVQAWSDAPRDHIVWGPVNPGRLDTRVSRAAYLREYGHFFGPLELGPLEFGPQEEREASELPGNNVVFPRELLPPPGDLARDGFWKTLHLERLARLEKRDLPVAVANRMTVVLQRHYRLAPYLRRCYLHGRCYGGCRLKEPGAPPRLLCLAFTPALPVLRTVRVVRRDRAKATRTGWLGRSLGAIVLAEIAWSAGEFAGYAWGEGEACDRLW
jgi:hypothetical protein